MAIDRRSGKGKVMAAMNRGFGALQRSVYRASKGKVMGKTAGVPVLLLTVTGRKTGKRRTVPLVYWERDGEYVVSASAGGTWLPMWYRNLQADPRVEVEVGAKRFSSTARLADADESRELWSVTESLNPRFAKYPESLPHEIPMVVLAPDP
ncbi:MAG TPA: nitroreductase/quinone reductase family protein [Acidimicrobiales bacterium]|nr:nitroreductase/quinone reductase family protein [Acidimicrobiales bacterium]